MASPASIRELRYRSGTTFNTTFIAADTAATWSVTNSTKLRVTSCDLSGLTYEADDDPTLESQLLRGRAKIPTLRKGVIKFGAWAEGGESTTAANPMATLLSKICGGIVNPATARTATALTAGSDADTIASTGIGAKVQVGQALLCGVRGDGDGEAEVRVISAEATDAVNVSMNLQAAMVTNAVAVISTTVFPDPTATQSYLDFLAIGHSAEDQMQAVGGMGSFTVEGLNPGELPKFGFEINVADWQEVASGDRASLAPATAPSGDPPAANRGLGGFFLGDASSNTRTVFKVADVTFNPGVTYEAVPGMNGVNGIEGWQMVPSVPTLECTVLLEGSTDPLPGFYDDFVAGTAKQCIVQCGSTATKCFAIDMPYCTFDGAPVRTTVGNLQAVKVNLRGLTQDLTAINTAQYLAKAGWRIHFF
jgi:hypothetical protein